ncbi:Glycerol-3-phosphate ABC transporter, periplasmic glycerol-3-phosphate-binding protein [Serinibacter arcticus]|uniref:Glycerol-3-phosphate ABC transporter, periplasmic glycerol-3-phosphate-binding protein n=1 Tax=Serinibacter arcticus TaxID=1655435 RepID=A0A4Z1E276_9MICO|nr:Glycerol-3-phosphate ABC transporter, periplasmic glycerol-3-phosphate-binding protein [Serinibacter arcticus]
MRPPVSTRRRRRSILAALLAATVLPIAAIPATAAPETLADVTDLASGLTAEATTAVEREAFPTAETPEGVSIVGGVTAPRYDYGTAVRERVFIPVEGVDQDGDGVTDVTAIDIIRPAATETGLMSPAIIDTSPYYTTLGRGNESERLNSNLGGVVTDLNPLYYDNYFVPRGYTVIHAQMNGTGFSNGCPLHGGAGDIESLKVVVDWLNGRVPGFDADGAPVDATWHNGKSAMFGKSYDGTLANGVAATGVEGLETIVPIDAITQWYRYSRTNGIRHNTHYPQSLSNTVTNPERRELCAPTRAIMNEVDGDTDGDVNDFWQERNYQLDADNVTAAVFAIQGLNDDNVRMSQFNEWWDALAANDVPRKVWLPRQGHIDPFDFRRTVWVDTIHRWYDHWLMGIDNGIMDEPESTVEQGVEEYVDEASWPAPGTQDVAVHLTGTTPGAAGDLALQPTTGEGATETLTFTNPANSINENNLISAPEGQQANRLAFLSEPLENELRISGTPRIELDASLSTDQANLGAVLVDYGTAERVSRSGDGSRNTTVRTCWGAGNATDTGCYLEKERVLATADFWRLSRGALDSSNRTSLMSGKATPVVPGTEYGFDFDMEPYDYVFPAGHRIGVVLTTNLQGFNLGGTVNATVSLDAATSTIVLPIVGGTGAAVASGGLGDAAGVTLDFDLLGEGTTAVEPQVLAYGATPTEPAEPVDGELVFAGWFADEALTVPFDFTAALTTDTTAYARWITVIEAAVSLDVTVSATTALVGESVDVTVTATDADGDLLGDVTSLVTFSSTSPGVTFSGASATLGAVGDAVVTATLSDATGTATVEVLPIPFVDVPLGTLFFDEIRWLSDAGISTGWPTADGEREFRPFNPVARDAMAAFLYRLAEPVDYTPPATSPFVDVPVGSQFYTEIAWLADEGISTGWVRADGTREFRPLDSINRDAMAAFLYRLAEVEPGTAPTTTPFTDVPSDSQFATEIAWVASVGISTGWQGNDGTAVFRPVTPIARDAIAAFLYRFDSLELLG